MNIDQLFADRLDKDWLVGRLRANSADFEAAFETALSGPRPLNWRAAWIVGHAMDRCDPRLQDRLHEIIDSIRGKEDGHQRELLRILQRLDITEDCEGPLFDACMSIWEELSKSPGVRYFAFRHMFRIVEKYPELRNDLVFVTVEEYVATLSPGIKRSVKRLIGRLGYR